MLKEPEAPHQPSEDDTRPVSGRGDDRLLLWCLIGSLFINFGFGLWLNYADLYGEKHEADVNKVMHFKTYIPPVKKPKPPPKPKKIPPPPKPKIIPKLVVKPLPHPPPPLPRPIAPQVYNTPTKSQNAIQTGPPQPPPTTPQTQAPSDNTDIPTPKPNPQPQPQPQQDTPKPAPPPPPPPPVHRPGYSDVAEQEADALSDYPNPDVPADADVTTLHSCTITFTVSETGRVTNARVTGRSGNSDLDDSCLHAVQGMRFKPAIQDHYPQEQRMSHTFSFAG